MGQRGGRFLATGGLGMTLQGLLPQDDRWRLAYAASSPIDTENGYRPQNIFRLVTRRQWKDFDQEIFFRIRRVNMTESPSRAGHNGVLFLQRCLDDDNLYYAGIRVDGAAVVKRKKAGVYTTLAAARVYSGVYDRLLNSSLIPLDRWIGLRAGVADLPDGSGVSRHVQVNDPVATGGWVPVIEVVDPAGSAIVAGGAAGIRTDFADVEFEGYQAAQRCEFSITPLGETFPAAGGQGTVSVSAPAGCGWAAASAAAWITVLGGSGTGDGSATYLVAANPGAAPRTGSLTVAEQELTVSQRGSPCTFSLSSTGQSFGAGAGMGTVGVVTPFGCTWSATSGADWIRITSGAAGSGPGAVTYQIAANPKRSPRTGTLTIAGRSFTISQARSS